MHPPEKRYCGQCDAQRSLLLRLRLIFREFCQFSGLYGGAVRRRSPVRAASGGSGHPLHRVHELQRKAGPKGGRGGVGHFGGSCLLRHQKRPVQGHQAGRRPRAGSAHRGAGRHLLQQGGAARFRAHRRRGRGVSGYLRVDGRFRRGADCSRPLLRPAHCHAGF